MRWILIVLLMCNGIYFLWQTYLLRVEQPVAVAAGVNSGDEGAGLKLLSEEPGLTPTPEPAPGQAAPERLVAGLSGGEKPVDAVAASPVEVSIPSNICWWVGPFKEEISGKLVVSRLEALDMSLQLRNIEIPGKPDYWVHLPPQSSRKVAVKLLRELQAKKIDSFLITEGELENGLSLGFFTQQPSAESVHKKRMAQGYDARIKVVPRTYTELWAVFDVGEYGKFSDALWEKIQQGNAGLERRKNYCDKIASVDDLD